VPRGGIGACQRRESQGCACDSGSLAVGGEGGAHFRDIGSSARATTERGPVGRAESGSGALVTSARHGHHGTGTATATTARPKRHTPKEVEVSVGVAQPLGATPTPTGVNFSVDSEHATSVTLQLFDSHRARTPDHEIVLNARDHKSFHFWHCHVAGVGPGQVYEGVAAGGL
jgi:hypothetical protein